MVATTSAHSSPAHSTAAAASIPAPISIALFVGKQNGVDQSVGALGGGDSIEQSFLAAPVDSVSENDDRFASLLLFHDFVRRQIDRIVKQGSATAPAVRTVPSARTAIP